MSRGRAWVIEGKSDVGWVPMAGELFTNRRYAYRALRSVRTKFSKDYTPDTFRLVEYAPLAQTKEKE